MKQSSIIFLWILFSTGLAYGIWYLRTLTHSQKLAHQKTIYYANKAILPPRTEPRARPLKVILRFCALL